MFVCPACFQGPCVCPTPTPKKLIKINDYLTSFGRYPERAKSEELNDHIRDKAYQLIGSVNSLLLELGVEKVDITSGYRPSEANKAAKGASKSAHMTGMAIDILDDKDQTLAKSITIDLLKKHDLYMEDSEYTRGKYTNWVHLQTRPTFNRIFKP